MGDDLDALPGEAERAQESGEEGGASNLLMGRNGGTGLGRRVQGRFEGAL